MAVSPWSNTKRALEDLTQLLTCSLCKKLQDDLYSFDSCDHYFCRECAVKAVNDNSKCPTCGAFAWVTDLKVNRQLVNTVSFCKELEKLITAAKKGNGKSKDLQDQNFSGIEKNTAISGTSTNEDSPATTIPIENNRDDSKISKPSEASVSPFDKSTSLYCENVVTENNCDIESSLSSWSAKTRKVPAQTYDKKVGEKVKLKSKKLIAASALTRRDTGTNNKDLSVFQFTVTPDNDISMQETENGSNRKENVPTGIAESKENKPKRTKAKDKSLIQATTAKRTNLRVASKAQVWDKKPEEKKQKIVKELKSPPNTSKATGAKQIKNLRKRNIRGETPLHVACIKGDANMVETLLKNGADPNTKDFAGWTPLHEASNHGFVKIVELLLDHEAMVNIPGMDHDTPLHDAVANHRIEVATILVRRGACTTTRNKQGLLPVDYAKTIEMKNILTSMPGIIEESLANTSLKSGHRITLNDQTQPKVLLSTGLTDREKAELKRCAKSLGAKVLEEFSCEVTHLITRVNGKGLCARTIKYLTALIHGKWAVSMAWIKQSLKSKTWQNEEEFEVTGTEDAPVNAPQRARRNEANMFPSLFDGCSFFLYGAFTSPTKEEIHTLIKRGCGNFLTREPKIDEDVILLSEPSSESKLLNHNRTKQGVVFHAKPSSGMSVCTQYVLYDEKAPKKPKIIHSPTHATVPVAWLLDCISNFEIVPLKECYVNSPDV